VATSARLLVRTSARLEAIVARLTVTTEAGLDVDTSLLVLARS